MPLDDNPATELMRAALQREAEGQRALLDGDGERGRAQMLEAATLYRQSWELAAPDAFGRLVGMLKAAIIGGDASAAAAFARAELPDPPPSAAAAYALAMAALAEGDARAAAAATLVMREGSDAFGRAADGIVAIARDDAAGAEQAIRAIVSDFESRDQHITGVPIADTALMLIELANAHGIDVSIDSELLP